jgi:hypothetical protein
MPTPVRVAPHMGHHGRPTEQAWTLSLSDAGGDDGDIMGGQQNKPGLSLSLTPGRTPHRVAHAVAGAEERRQRDGDRVEEQEAGVGPREQGVLPGLPRAYHRAVREELPARRGQRQRAQQPGRAAGAHS